MTRNHFIELQTHRQSYKKAFIDDKLWAILAQTLGKLLKKDFADRTEDDGLVIERILILIRNILQVPRDSQGERRTGKSKQLFQLPRLSVHPVPSVQFHLSKNYLQFL